MKRLDTLFIGFMLFSMFFGAGNLIFPPILGAESGTNFWMAILGFIITGVGLPFAVLIATALVKGGVETIGNRVHPIFSTIFMVIVYLGIGPLLAIPRNANVAFEMGITPFLNGSINKSFVLFFFSLIFFSLVFVISLNPSKMEKYMGRWITPTLLIAIVVLCVAGFVQLHTPFQPPTGDYQSGAFFTGFLEGYNTMDALAALAFGIVILSAIQKRGLHDHKQLRNYTLKASFIAGFLLAVIYVGLGLLGAKMGGMGSFKDGTDILATGAIHLLGTSGTVLLGFIFTLACFTTIVGLTTACGHYFSKLIPKMSYKTVVLLVTILGFTLSNLGLNEIIKVSVPFLVTAYPLTIVLIMLTFFNHFFRRSESVYRSAILFTCVFAVIGGLNSSGLHLELLQSFQGMLPLSSVGLDWLVPALIGTGIGLILNLFNKKEQIIETMNLKDKAS